MNDFDKQFKWQDKHLPRVTEILGRVFFRKASFEEDTKQATDITLKFNHSLDIGVRLRKKYKYTEEKYNEYKKEFTIRTINGEAKTELNKIIDGNGSHIFYGWIDKKDGAEYLYSWTIIDLNIFRKEYKDVIQKNNKQLIKNKDSKTQFLAFLFNEFSKDFIISDCKASINI